MKPREIVNSLFPTDFVFISFYLALSLVNLIFHSRIEIWAELIFYNFLIISTIVLLAYMDKTSKKILWKQFHYWYLVPLVFLTFKEIHFMIQPIRIIDYDNVLIQIDRFIFGTDPTRALFTIANPVLTELLQIVYGTFFFLPVILAIDLMLNDRYEDVKFATFTVVWGFVLSYIGYFLVPAIGPRFTLHDFAATNTELPGLFLTNYLREIVNAGESIAKGIPNPAEVVQRDVFPSGHTQMTLIVMYLSIKMKTKSRYFFAVNGTLLIFSTVYLRYHYAVDVLGGILFMIITIWSGKYLYNWWIKKSGGILYDNS